MVHEAEENAESDRARREIRRVKNRLEGLIYTNERVLEQFSGALPDGDRNRVREAMSQARSALTSEDRAEMEAAMFDLNSVSKMLSDIMLNTTAEE